MKIRTDETAAIESELRRAQGRARARTLDADDIAWLAKAAEGRLDRLGIPLRLRKGATAARYDADLAKSYDYRAESTMVTIERGSTGREGRRNWYLTSVDRVPIYPGESSRCQVNLTDDQHQYLVDKLPRAYGLG